MSDECTVCGAPGHRQFLPEQVSTWVLSVYEIERTVERLGEALADPNGTTVANVTNATVPDLAKQIENWQTVLRTYRAATVTDQAESIADQLQAWLTEYQTNVFNFLEDSGRDKPTSPQFRKTGQPQT